MAISPQLSGQNIQIDSSPHLPLSRIVYKQKMGLLPRASLERKGSSEDDHSATGVRRDSNNSDKSRKSSGFSASEFDVRSLKRQGPDGHEVQDRRSSNESVKSNKPGWMVM